MATHTLFADFTALPGAEERVTELVQAFADSVRCEAGNVAFNAYTWESNPRHFVLHEAYADDAALRTHSEAPYVAAFNAELAKRIEGDGSELTWLVPLPAHAL